MKHSLIVGGTRGIGKAIALKLCSDEMWVSVVGRSTETVSEKIQKHGPLTNLVFAQRYRGDDDPLSGEIETSIKLTIRTIEECQEHFDGGGSIVILSSLIAHTVADEQPVSYHLAKGALESIIRYYAVKLGPRHHIHVNGIAPGVVLKEENKAYYADHPEKVSLFSQLNPLGRMGTAVDIANAVWLLCQPEAYWITGQTIVVDGGVSLINQEALARSFLPKGNN